MISNKEAIRMRNSKYDHFFFIFTIRVLLFKTLNNGLRFTPWLPPLYIETLFLKFENVDGKFSQFYGEKIN